jgi:capsular polysaccharide biosynthesis protein
LRCAEVSRRPKPIPDLDAAGKSLASHHNNAFDAFGGVGYYTLADCILTEQGYTFAEKTGQLYDSEDIDHPYWREKYQAQIHRKAATLGKEKQIRRVRANEGVFVRLINPGYKVYGHWLLDLLPAAWLVSRISPEFGGKAITYVIADDTPSWALNMFFSLSWHKSDKLLRFSTNSEFLAFEQLIIPSYLTRCPIVAPMFDDFINDVLTDTRGVPESARGRFWVSRSRAAYASGRILDNRLGIEHLVARLGLSVIYPEEMSWSSQLSLFRNARLIAGEFGSGLHNAAFSPSDCDVVCVSSSQSNMIQSGISALRSQRLQYVPSIWERREDESLYYGVDTEVLMRCLARTEA